MNRLIPLFLFLLPACATFDQMVSSSGSTKDVASSQFERIKALSGTWTGEGKHGNEIMPVEVRYRLTAGGSVVEETLFPGSEHEMVTMYHLDNGRVMLTHYCVAGNQPSMAARTADGGAGGSIATIRFDFAGATNMASPGDGHMHEVEMTFEGQDKLTTTWTYWKDEKADHQMRMELSRKPAGA